MSVRVEKQVMGANRTHLAKQVGLNRGHVSLVLSGKKEPGISVAKLLAEGLGLSLDEFHQFWEKQQAAN